eukprot:gnl/MRDRNA2_/MRDRNA2_72121_c0_seq1.p1 gnl/MRDRNA2_/MRDRNA2_72121_c0~~gnl/MRDRNA2_/MRDRNA2_72121_c0_seq1.p1  ORF type:complete len:486 (+),score=105.08 gnl/MRDRNA2_/MRDRNA2_72121_c0_seq1:45-1502(+)
MRSNKMCYSRPLHTIARNVTSLQCPSGGYRRMMGYGRIVTGTVPLQSKVMLSQRRLLHAALVASGLGDAIAALPGASKDKQGKISVPMKDSRLDVLAALERTKPVPAILEVQDLEAELIEELNSVVTAGGELSGKLLSQLRASDAVILAVPCREGVDPVEWFESAEKALITADLDSFEQQVCKNGSTGADAELDVAKLQKSLVAAKDPAVRRAADELVTGVVAPGINSLRARLRAGFPAREARPGLARASSSMQFDALDPRFEDLTRSQLNVLTTWRPMLVLADVPEADAADSSGSPMGNENSRRLSDHVAKLGMTCLVLCTALEGETVQLQEEPEFLAEYLESFGLIVGSEKAEADTKLRPWHSQSAKLTRCLPRELNLLTYFTAGEKEARMWMCPRVQKDGLPLAYQGTEGVPAFLAARAIHTSFEQRVKQTLLWKFEDLAALEPDSSGGPGGKERAKKAGKMQRLPRDGLVQEGDVVEFELK